MDIIRKKKNKKWIIWKKRNFFKKSEKKNNSWKILLWNGTIKWKLKLNRSLPILIRVKFIKIEKRERESSREKKRIRWKCELNISFVIIYLALLETHFY